MGLSRFPDVWRRRCRLREAGIAVAVGLACSALAYRMQGMHRGDISLPDRDGDTLGLYMLVKAMQQHGWYTPNPSLGYPSGQDLAAYPNLDLVNLLILKFCSLLFDNPFGPVRLFDFLAFSAIGAVGYLVMRYAGVRILVAVPLAVSLSLAPWHFQRLSGHIFLANYTPLLVGLFVALFALRRIRGTRTDDSPGRLAASIGLLLACGFYLSGSGLYWLFASGIMVALATVPALIANLSRRSALYAAAALVPAPIFAYTWLRFQGWSSSYPVVVESFTRQTVESELYGGSVATLFLPSPQSGIAGFAAEREGYETWTLLATNWESGPWNSAIGILAVSVTLLALLASASTLWGIRPLGWVERLRGVVDAPRADGWFAAFVTALLMFAVTAFGTLTMIFLLPEIRAWGRFFVLVIVVATVTLGILLTAATRLTRSWVPAAVVSALLVGIFFADQFRGDYRTDFVTRTAIAADAKAFDDAVEAAVPAGCPILNLPIMPFPEHGPIAGMKDYDPLWLYVQSTDLRFTYGVPKFQPEARWQDQFAQPLTPALLDTARAAGICGIAVDTFGYGGPDAPDAQSIRYLVGGEPILSPTRRWMFLRL